MNHFIIILSFIILLVKLIKYQTADILGNPAPIVFGEIGQTVTIHSRVKEISNDYTHVSWYRQRPSGNVELVARFTGFTVKIDRYSGKLPKNTEIAYLNVSSAAISDSGHYFAVECTLEKLTPGFPAILAVTDPKGFPVMRVFLSHASGTVLCELKGGGPHWSDPQWEIEDGEKSPKLLRPKAETFVDEHGAFIRSSILSLEDGIRGLNCTCQHSTGVIIRTRVMQDSEDQCQLMLYLSPLAAVMLLVTVAASGLWAWRQWKPTPITQGMDSNDGI